MTMTPEEQAEGICAALARAEAAFDKRGWVEMPKADRDRYVQRASLAAPLIALAIREAEDAALERAAVRLGEQSEDQLMTRWGVAAERFASDIRSLKHNKD